MRIQRIVTYLLALFCSNAAHQEAKMSKATLELVRQLIPSFKKPSHKGGHGKVLVIGGSVEYTGAPYYAGVSSLKVGSDLAYIACVAEAAVPIKAYSPELIVHPVLPSSASLRSGSSLVTSSSGTGGASSIRSDGSQLPAATADEKSAKASVISDGVSAVTNLLERADSVVIGPGLGRDPTTLEVVARVIEILAKRRIPTVIDGDGLFLLAQSPGLIARHSNAILTPNAVEFKRLWDATSPSNSNGSNSGGSATLSGSSSSSSFGLTDSTGTGASGGGSGSIGPSPSPGDPHDHSGEALELSRRLGGVAVVRKGTRDVIAVAGTKGTSSTSADLVAVVADPSSPRRCGGQGDVLAGSLGTFLAWAARGRLIGPAAKEGGSGSPSQAEALVACGYGASLLTRTAASYAFEAHRRSTTTPDIIDKIGTAFEDVFQDSRLYRLPAMPVSEDARRYKGAGACCGRWHDFHLLGPGLWIMAFQLQTKCSATKSCMQNYTA